ncbi:MAG TPA: glycosyltransferase [Acidimicrobiia bacterium]|jgi:glycosyltransferase involved in cell wall biosynthesis|nr:glycosyltransferase [Acidimicrobiia bacterium]
MGGTRALSEGMTIAVVSSYYPTRCGVGRFTRSLRTALEGLDPHITVAIARLLRSKDLLDYHSEVEVAFDPTNDLATRGAAERINTFDVAVLQHEFGLYGPEDGEAVIALVRLIEIPVVSILHTVLSEPNPTQKSILQALAGAGMVVVPTTEGRDRLVARYQIPRQRVCVLPHGTVFSPAPVNPAPRRRLITWGLLGPGKGLERAIRAVGLLQLEPPVTYEIVGQTHPNVLAKSGEAYRNSLEQLVAMLGLGNRVRFVDRYLDDAKLSHHVRQADLVVTPYDNHEQICSGVLTDAVACGRPVVATAYAHASELLSTGAGIVVRHSEEDLAAAIEELLTNDEAYTAAAKVAADLSGPLSWESVAARLLDLLVDVRSRVEVA